MTAFEIDRELETMKRALYKAESAALRGVKYRCAWRDEKNHARARYTAAALIQATHDRIAKSAESAFLELSRGEAFQ